MNWNDRPWNADFLIGVFQTANRKTGVPGPSFILLLACGIQFANRAVAETSDKPRARALDASTAAGRDSGAWTGWLLLSCRPNA